MDVRSYAFDTPPSNEARYIETILADYSPAMIARIRRARARVDRFLDDCLDALVRDRPAVVGFISTFQQHVVSLALARRLKPVSPSTFVVLRGANCEGVMGAETLRSFPFVDAVVSGEADLISPELVRRLLRSQEVAGLLGVRTRGQIVEAFGLRARRHSVPAESIIDGGARRPRESTTDPRR